MRCPWTRYHDTMTHVAINQIQGTIEIHPKRNVPRAPGAASCGLCSRCICHKPPKHSPSWVVFGVHLQFAPEYGLPRVVLRAHIYNRQPSTAPHWVCSGYICLHARPPSVQRSRYAWTLRSLALNARRRIPTQRATGITRDKTTYGNPVKSFYHPYTERCRLSGGTVDFHTTHRAHSHPALSSGRWRGLTTRLTHREATKPNTSNPCPRAHL